MKVGDIVKRGNRGAGDESARYVLVEHHGEEGCIRLIGDGSSAPVERVPLSALALADNAPFVVDPADD
jgi:hypothetical protein